MINFEQILPIISKTSLEVESYIPRLIREIVIQNQKIKNSNQQSFYFRKALPNQIQKLQELKNEYQRIRTLFYQINVDDYVELLNKKEKIDTKNYPATQLAQLVGICNPDF